MIGNDVVDLGDDETSPGAQHPRFDDRVFCESELLTLASRASEPQLRWVMWAAKESAYKAAKRRNEDVIFSPPAFVVHLEDRSHGWVQHAGRYYPVHLNVDRDCIHAVAVDEDLDHEAIFAGVDELQDSDGADAEAPGRAARRLAREAVADKLGVEAARIAFGSEGRVPVVQVDETRAPALLSLSHHGRFAAFAFLLESQFRDEDPS